MPPDFALNPDPSRECTDHFVVGMPFAIRRCHTAGEQTDYTDWLHRPDLADSAVLGGRDYSAAGVTPGFAAGYPLLQYVLDWGDSTARVLRRRAHVSILKGWPRREDRTHALTLLARYVAQGDDCDPPLTTYLIHADPFAGWTWEPRALRHWLDLVEIDPSCRDFAGGLPEADAIDAAAAWIAHAEPLWRLYTAENFPYDQQQMIQLWLKNTRGADLPTA